MKDSNIQVGDKLTTIVRKDLSTGYKIVQTAHAVADFAKEHSEQFNSWKLGSNYLCCLEASEFKIWRIVDTLKDKGVKFTIFREPDIGNEMTAIAVESLPKDLHKQLFKSLNLAS